jgi:hypothetical protein
MSADLNPPAPVRSDFSDEEPTVVIPRITTREIVTLDPDGHYTRANGAVLCGVGVALLGLPALEVAK